MCVTEDFLSRGFFKIGNRTSTRFWEDIWLGDTPLAQQYPLLYNIVQRKDVSIPSVISHNPLNIGFRRVLSGNKWIAWLPLCQQLMTIHLSAELDNFVWKLTSIGAFPVKSIYGDVMNGHTRFLCKYL